jgi:hypothetical protein
MIVRILFEKSSDNQQKLLYTMAWNLKALDLRQYDEIHLSGQVHLHARLQAENTSENFFNFKFFK